MEEIGLAVKQIASMLRTLRMPSFNARIEAAYAGAGFSEVAREMGYLATVGDDVAKNISHHLGRLRDVVRV